MFHTRLFELLKSNMHKYILLSSNTTTLNYTQNYHLFKNNSHLDIGGKINYFPSLSMMFG